MQLNLGCGNDYLKDWVNVDKGNCKSDMKFDIEKLPWPIEDNKVTQILLKHILEHIKKDLFVDFCREMHRVCVDGAIIVIQSPYAISDNFYTDPTHVMPITTRTFDFFDKSKPLSENGAIYGWDDIHFTVIEAKLVDNPPNGPDVHISLMVRK